MEGWRRIAGTNDMALLVPGGMVIRTYERSEGNEEYPASVSVAMIFVPDRCMGECRDWLKIRQAEQDAMIADHRARVAAGEDVD